MNIQNSKKQDKLEQLLLNLNLTENNRKFAMEYLTSEEPDDQILTRMEAQNFRLLTIDKRLEAENYLHPIRDAQNKELLTRFYRLFWAMGKSTACYLLNTPFRSNGESKEDRIRILGKAAVAAMDTEYLSQVNHPYLFFPWLWELAETEPQVLVEAQTLSGEPVEERIKPILAGFLLGSNVLSDDDVGQQIAILLQAHERLNPVTMYCLPAPDRKVLTDYIDQGDPTAPLPQLSSGSFYTTGLKDFWQNHYTVDQMSGFLGSAAMMGQRFDPRLRCMAKVHLALNPRMVLLYGTQLMPKARFMEELPQILKDLPGGKASMLLFLTANYMWMDEDWKKAMASQCATGLPEVLAIADPNQFSALNNLLPGGMKALGVNVQEKVIYYMQNMVDTGEDELEEYLSGTGSLADSQEQLKAVTQTGYHNTYKVARMIRDHLTVRGWDDFGLRCAVVLGTVFDGSSLRELLAEDSGRMDLEKIPRLCDQLRSNGLSLTMTLNLLGNFHDHLYYEEGTKAILNCVSALLLSPIQTIELCHAAKYGNLFTRQQALRALNRDATEEARAGMLACTADTSKKIQSLLLELLPGHPDWAGDYAALLKSKKAAERILGAQILGKLGAVGIPALQQALETEKSPKVADAIRNALGDTAKPPVSGTEELVTRLLKSNKIKKLQWLTEQPLPAVRLLKEGVPAETDWIHAMLTAYCEAERIGRNDLAFQISGEMEPKDLEVLADEVFERWISAGAPAKQKWVLAFSSVYGGETVCRKLIRAIQEWPQNARGAIACDGVKALTLSSAPGALLAVDAMARKFKFRQVKVAAAAALDTAAQELGISVEELADRIVPDLGFSDNGTRIFNYGKRSFTVRLTPALELAITTDAGKPVKNLPAPGKTDEEPTASESYEAFKAMKKQIRTTVSTQKARLEAALAALRCWDSEGWRALFVRNPIMHQFAISLVWGVYEDGKLTDTFRYMEDGSFNTVDEEEYQLPEQARIGLVHPVELDDGLLEQWKQQLEDYEVTQSIPQLDRPVYVLIEEEQSQRILEAFGGKMLNGLSLSGKLTGLGWYRGSVVDGGAFYTYWREDPTLGLGVELRFSGSFVGDENDDVTVYDAVFYKAGTVSRGSYVYDTPKEENTFSLGQIPGRYYSEIMQQLTKATASSTETDDSWRNDRKDR